MNHCVIFPYCTKEAKNLFLCQISQSTSDALKATMFKSLIGLIIITLPSLIIACARVNGNEIVNGDQMYSKSMSYENHRLHPENYPAEKGTEIEKLVMSRKEHDASDNFHALIIVFAHAALFYSVLSSITFCAVNKSAYNYRFCIASSLQVTCGSIAFAIAAMFSIFNTLIAGNVAIATLHILLLILLWKLGGNFTWHTFAILTRLALVILILIPVIYFAIFGNQQILNYHSAVIFYLLIHICLTSYLIEMTYLKLAARQCQEHKRSEYFHIIRFQSQLLAVFYHFLKITVRFCIKHSKSLPCCQLRSTEGCTRVSANNSGGEQRSSIIRNPATLDAAQSVLNMTTIAPPGVAMVLLGGYFIRFTASHSGSIKVLDATNKMRYIFRSFGFFLT